MGHINLSLIQVLADKLRRTTCDPSHSLQVHDDLEALHRSVERIEAVLDDAEEREITDKSVRLWLKELKGVADDAEDVLDEYDYELLRAQVETGIQLDEATHPLPDKRKHQEASTSTTTSIPLDASFCGEIADKIRKIRDRFEDISKERDALHLREGDGRQRHSQVIAARPPSSHIVDAPEIYGRRDDMEEIIDQLLNSDECKRSNLSVLPIVGMGGVGKTTLVQHIYDDPRICEHFQMKGWVCVSDDFTVERLTERIIESLTKEHCDVKEFSVLQEKLKEIVAGRRFLLVLDDVWNDNLTLWESLQKPLRFGAQGSAVITTTRHESVAKIMKTMPSHHLDCLSFDDCLAVFVKGAFADGDPNDYPELMEIGRKIVEKCDGLPLAAKSLGGLLRRVNEVDGWDEVLQSDIWDLPRDGIIPALRLSYLHLPSYLKQCFCYAAVFPKDFEFKEEELIGLWMAQGFLQCRGSKQEAEDFGSKCCEELEQRSLFSYAGDDDGPCFVMHDLIHDLAQHISGGRFFHMVGDSALPPRSDEVRHVSAVDHWVLDLDMLLDAAGANIRTLMVRNIWRELKLPCQMMPHLGFLRALDLSSGAMDELPGLLIGGLKHLRYLNLDRSYIKRLPDSVCKLYHLQTLSLRACDDLRMLPEDIGNLCNLRRLNIEETPFEFVPSGFGKLTSLRELDEFPSPTVNNSSLPLLKDLIHLRGALNIRSLRYVMDAEDARLADLRSKTEIRGLRLDWWEGDDLSPWNSASETTPPEVQTQVLENLQPPDRLKELIIHRYDGLRLPSWMGADPSSLSKLVLVQLHSCGRCTSLPALGHLPYLEDLLISGMKMVEAVGPEFRGRGGVAFRALKKLRFYKMDSWVTWESAAERGDFPRLRHLTLWNCPELKSAVPLYLLPALEQLDIRHCDELTSISLWGGPPLTVGPPPNRQITVRDDERLSLPPALRDLIFADCPLMVEWSEGDDVFTRGFHGEACLDVHDGTKLVTSCKSKETVRGINWWPEIDWGWLRIHLTEGAVTYLSRRVQAWAPESGQLEGRQIIRSRFTRKKLPRPIIDLCL